MSTLDAMVADGWGPDGPGRLQFDLHMHTNRSDGRFEPAEVLRRCAAGGLDVVAMTDHDLSTALPAGVHHMQGRDIRVIAGAEVSGSHDGHEFHLLTYFPDQVPEGFQAFCAKRCEDRRARYVSTLASLGLKEEQDPNQGGPEAITRLHLAHELVQRGVAKNRRDAFRRFLGDKMGHVPALNFSFVDAIRVARSFGAITSWAHPPMSAVDQYLETFAAAGLQAIEGLRPALNARQRNKLKRAAKRHGLVLTGGSDWHGHPGDPDLGLFRLNGFELEDFLALLVA